MQLNAFISVYYKCRFKKVFKEQMKYKLIVIFSISIIFSTVLFSNNKTESAVQLARVKYSGGGDWYNDPSGEPNLLKFVKKNTNIIVKPIYKFVELASDDLFQFPLIFLTGHGNINFSPQEAKNLRAYLENGGFLYIDDDYGLDKYIREEMKKVFPDSEFKELPFSHGIYKSHFDFNNGIPKTHEHDEKSPKAYGLFYNGEMVSFYTVESNPSDGWADPEIHKDPENKRIEALKLGTNIIVWALSN